MKFSNAKVSKSDENAERRVDKRNGRGAGVTSTGRPANRPRWPVRSQPPNRELIQSYLDESRLVSIERRLFAEYDADVELFRRQGRKKHAWDVG